MIILKLFTVILLTLFIWMLMQLIISGFRVVSFFKYGMRQANPARPAQPHNTMVKCATCNLYVLDTDAISRNGNYYCSVEHMKNP